MYKLWFSRQKKNLHRILKAGFLAFILALRPLFINRYYTQAKHYTNFHVTISLSPHNLTRDSRISTPNPARRNRSDSHAPDAKHIVSLSLPHTCNLYDPGRFRPQSVLPCVSLRHVLLTKWHSFFVSHSPSIRRKIGGFSTFLSRLAPKRPASCGEKSGFLRRKKMFSQPNEKFSSS